MLSTVSHHSSEAEHGYYILVSHSLVCIFELLLMNKTFFFFLVGTSPKAVIRVQENHNAQLS